MAHKNDVIFTEQGLAEFIQQIRQNPEMVYKVRAATDEEIAKHNEVHPTLAEGRIPGKGITIIQANGDKFSVAVGSDVKAPDFEKEIKNNTSFKNGTVTFIVDETYINIPIKGIIKDWNGTYASIDDNREIPSKDLVEQYVDTILNGNKTDIETGYGFIPGYYELINKKLSDSQIEQINNQLNILNIPIVDGVTQLNAQGKIEVIINNNGEINKLPELLTLLQSKKEQTNTLYTQANKTKQELIEQEQNLAENTDSTLLQELQVDKQKKNEEKQNLEFTLNQNNYDQQINDYENLIDEQQDIIQMLTDRYNLTFNANTILGYINIAEQDLIKAGIEDLSPENLTLKANEIEANLEELTDPELIQQQENTLALIYKYSDFKHAELALQNIEQFTLAKENLEDERDALIAQINDIIEEINKIDNDIAEITQNIQTLDNIRAQIEELETEENNYINTLLIISQTEGLVNKGSNKKWTVIETQSNKEMGHEIASLQAEKVYGAVFNDYAEYRNTVVANPGRVVIENGDGSLSLATKRLQLGANIVSDTYGFAIGKTDDAQTPIAVCGRVLAYPYEERKLFTPGAAVCSGPNGTISLMTREEIREWPDAIVGYVSEIPAYEYWGTDNITVDGRIWIKVK